MKRLFSVLSKSYKIYSTAKCRIAESKKQLEFHERVHFLKRTGAPFKSDRPFYIVYRESDSAGFFSYLYAFFAEIEGSVKKGMVPIVDMKNFSAPMGYKSNGVNFWELFYQQPLGFSLDDAYSSSSLSHCRNATVYASDRLSFSMDWVNNSLFLASQRDSFKRLIRLQPDIENLIEDSRKIFQGKKSLIGISLRGLDYPGTFGHPIQPDIEEILQKCDFLLQSGEYDGIYLVSTDIKIHNAFKLRYGADLIVTYPRRLIEYEPQTTNLFQNIAQHEDIYIHLRAYVISFYLLQFCKHIIASITSSSVFIPLICSDNTSLDLLFRGIYREKTLRAFGLPLVTLEI
jgi:hypothetical protein